MGNIGLVKLVALLADRQEQIVAMCTHRGELYLATETTVYKYVEGEPGEKNTLEPVR